ncbi:hypothetical protein F0562_031525 [Nyssa sinensis]|uniref:Amino acid transporter transmembrane domain-containing protein n=1 Tax=Nyssa sinensis TaxID=561372 RepID=A0A5J5AUR6_9ASTE|nr:hypothetical protein F0562_031525 [Nyssa sinensis]
MKPGETGAGVLAPLLPEVQPVEDERAESGASISGAVFNVSTSMVGAGIMSIPATLKVLGIVPGFFVILIVAFLVEVTVEFLLRYTHSGESTTYAGLMAEVIWEVLIGCPPNLCHDYQSRCSYRLFDYNWRCSLRKSI